MTHTRMWRVVVLVGYFITLQNKVVRNASHNKHSARVYCKHTRQSITDAECWRKGELVIILE